MLKISLRLILLAALFFAQSAWADDALVDFTNIPVGTYSTDDGSMPNLSLPDGVEITYLKIGDCQSIYGSYPGALPGCLSGPDAMQGNVATDFRININPAVYPTDRLRDLVLYSAPLTFGEQTLRATLTNDKTIIMYGAGQAPGDGYSTIANNFTSWAIVQLRLSAFSGFPSQFRGIASFKLSPKTNFDQIKPGIHLSFGPNLKSPSSTDCPTLCPKGQPVNLANGLLWHATSDFSIPGRTEDTALSFNRIYTANDPVIPGDLGANWHHNFETKLLKYNSDVVWIDEKGGPWLFVPSTENSFTSPPGLNATLTKNEDIFELKKPNGTKLTFNFSGKLLGITDRYGESLTISYDAIGRLASVSSPLAGSMFFSRNGSGKIASITRSRDDLTYNFEYESGGRLRKVTDFSNHSYTYTYITDMPNTAAQGRLASIKDPLNRTLTFTYYEDGKAYQQFEPEGGVRTFVYGNLKTTMTEIDGLTYRYFFDQNHNLIKEVLPDGTRKYATWNDARVTSTWTDFGGKTKYTYDANGNLASIQRPEDSAPTTITYDLNFNKPTQVQPLVGASTDFTLDPSTGDALQMSRGNLALVFTRDPFGNVLSVDNGKTTYSQQRNLNGQLTNVFDLHNPETRTYDGRARLSTRSFLSGRTLTYTYDDYDRVLTITDSHGPKLINSYDAMGRLLERAVVSGSISQVTKYAYDGQDRLVSVTDALDRLTTFAYDPERVFNKPISITDPANRTTYFEYDLLHRLIKKTDANSAITKYSYDQRNNLTSVTDANGGVTRYEYDLNNRKIREVRPSVAGATAVERHQLYFYDPAGRLVREVTKSATGGADRFISYEYDPLDRLVKKEVGTEGNSFVDRVINMVTSKKRSLTVDDSSVYTYEDQLDATLLKTAVNGVASLGFANEAAPPFAGLGFSVAASEGGNPLGLIEGNFEISRDVTGEIAEILKDSTSLFTKSYDPAGRLTGVSAGSFSTTIGYDGFGRRETVSHSTGESGSFQMDLLNRITQVTWTGPTPISETLTYDPLTGNITELGRENGSSTIAYDAIDQLVSSTGAYNHSLTYDALGNRSQSSQNGSGTFVNNFLVSNGHGNFPPVHAAMQVSYLADPDGFGDTGRESSAAAIKNYLYRADDRMNVRWA